MKESYQAPRLVKNRVGVRRRSPINFCVLTYTVLTLVGSSIGFVITHSVRPVPSHVGIFGRQRATPSGFDGTNNEQEEEEIEMLPVCRIVSRADSRLPSNPSILPPQLLEKPFLLDKLDSYFHAQAHRQTQDLSYLRRSSSNEVEQATDASAEHKLVSVVRDSLENAGFELLSKRDIDLCESLNAEYLLRLSIRPDLAELDDIAQEFYPERFNETGNPFDDTELLFDGRVLVYWRSYSKEVTNGRLILPKLDYLQANLVQRFASWVNRWFFSIEQQVTKAFSDKKVKLKQSVREKVLKGAESIRDEKVSQFLQNGIKYRSDQESTQEGDNQNKRKSEGSIKLGRYGGSKVRFVGSPDPGDALDPFMICEVKYYQPTELPNNLQYNGTNVIDRSVNVTAANAESDMNDQLNHQGYTCEYDTLGGTERRHPLPRMQLLERISISNLVDIFSKSGRQKFIKALFEKSELVEPTYEEVVVLWRPKKPQKRVYYPPKFISEFADMFDIEGFEQPPADKLKPPKEQLEIRTFEGVPMANLPAVLPKTKLVFRPADAFLFDLISIATFSVVLGSIRLDSPKLDLLAIISVVLWTIRTIFRYSNKLARYDLLVKNFLTSKIAHRNEGALKYIISEAGSQRAIRSSLVHTWLSGQQKDEFSSLEDSDGTTISKSDLQLGCVDEINALLTTQKEVQVNVERALKDLKSLDVVTFSEQEELVITTKSPRESSEAIKEAWCNLLETEGDGDIKGTNRTIFSTALPL